MSENELENHSIKYDTDGKPVKTIPNIINHFYADENLNKLFVFNEFSGTIEYSRNAIWHDVEVGQELRDKDIIFVQYYLALNRKMEVSIEKLTNAITEIAERNHYHPVRFYLSQLEWDGQPRLDTWLINAVGTEDNAYTRAVGSKYLMAAVARVYQPGVKFDNVLVFEGEENIGKSTVFRTLSNPWFTDSIDLMQKDEKIIEKMRGSWFLEVAEMFGVNDSNQERIKSFLTRQDDVHRLPYDRLSVRLKRQSIFCGSSNKLAYLFGEDGNRRFWPIKCEKINIEWLKENRDQIFAEALYRWRSGEVLYLNPELFEFAKKVQTQKLSVNEVWYEIIERNLVGKNETVMAEVLKFLNIDIKDLHNRAYLTNIGRILKKLGFEKRQRVNIYGEKFVYLRENVLGEMEKKRIFNEEEE